ncbi:hypothetical protein KC238_21135 [Mycobacteroides chelonae]|uniref:hypothetical protein n=1 Tax=Mycobacteroides chelonae TaxID=1774 RepID=UPI001C2C11B2|nr:hypothetical protein [Mycobacteroides chelonae]MBV0919763.1 hypothetical protein [Mycobacteroides chelonae]
MRSSDCGDRFAFTTFNRAHVGAVHAHVIGERPLIRRLLNQAIFTRLYIDDEGIHGGSRRAFPNPAQ